MGSSLDTVTAMLMLCCSVVRGGWETERREETEGRNESAEIVLEKKIPSTDIDRASCPECNAIPYVAKERRRYWERKLLIQYLEIRKYSICIFLSHRDAAPMATVRVYSNLGGMGCYHHR